MDGLFLGPLSARAIPDGQADTDLQRHWTQLPSCSLTTTYYFSSTYLGLLALSTCGPIQNALNIFFLLWAPVPWLLQR